MPLQSHSVGATGEWVSTPIDPRWTMAYAAGLGEVSAQYADTVARPDVLAATISNLDIKRRELI